MQRVAFLSWPRPRHVVAAAAVSAAVLAGCGVPVDEAPRAIATAELPSGQEAPGTASAVTAPKVERAVYLLGDGRLVRAARSVAAPGDAAALVTTLLEGPTERETDWGMRSAIPPETQLLSSTLDASVATLDFSVELADVGGEAQRYSLAQLVWTATAAPGVDSVRIAVEGERVSVPDPEGQLVDRPLTREDFPPQLDPLPQPTVTLEQ